MPLKSHRNFSFLRNPLILIWKIRTVQMQKFWVKYFACAKCEISRCRSMWNEINPLTPAGISHAEGVFHARRAFHKSWKDLFRSKKPPIFIQDWRFFLVAADGFEPSTLRVWTACSSQLSYAAIYGADNQDWTGDLILTKDTLYRLSYISNINIWLRE